MTSVRKLKLAAGAGKPDDVLALMIDVVVAAVAYVDSYTAKGSNLFVMENAQWNLERVVRRYKAALKRRERA